MIDSARKAYKKVQEAARIIYEELEKQIEPSQIILRSSQLPKGTLEKDFMEALEYLSEKGLINYSYDTKSTAAFYEYDRKYKDALAIVQSEEYFMNENKLRNTIWQDINLYDKQRAAEAEQWHIALFTIQPLLGFETACKEILSKYSDRVRYKLRLSGPGKNILCVNNIYKLHTFYSATWQLQLMQRALSSVNEAFIEAPKDAKKGMPQLMQDVISSAILRKLFVPVTNKNGFVIRHTITDEFVKTEQLDTKKIESELRKRHANAK